MMKPLMISVAHTGGPPAGPTPGMAAATRAHYKPVECCAPPGRRLAQQNHDEWRTAMGGKDEVNGYDVFEHEIVTSAETDQGQQEADDE